MVDSKRRAKVTFRNFPEIKRMTFGETQEVAKGV